MAVDKKFPEGIQNIKEVLNGPYVYVDKTLYAKHVLDTRKYQFLSRPRRFGKSLFIDTLKEILTGNKDLFTQCAIYQTDYAWQPHYVLHFDFYRLNNATSAQFKQSLHHTIKSKAAFYDICLPAISLESDTEVLVKSLADKGPVAVLVDEYDHPLINHVDNTDITEGNQNILRHFFGLLKSLDAHLNFMFVTGITKVAQASLFSGPNNMVDISMDPSMAEAFGYTEPEVDQYLTPYIQALSKARETTTQAIRDEMKNWYNGYRFTEKDTSVYNPYSLMGYLSNQTYPKNYWYNTGTPRFLLKKIQQRGYLNLKHLQISDSQLSQVANIHLINLPSLLYQTGYLTIKSIEHPDDNCVYTLDFPNKEVRKSFLDSLLIDVGQVSDQSNLVDFQQRLKTTLTDLSLALFFQEIQWHFSRLPYFINTNKSFESYYHSIFFALLMGSDLMVQAEVPTSLGRIDMVIETSTYRYIIEIKLNRSGAEALDQIYDKKYYTAYLNQDNRPLVLVGINFDSTEKNLSDWCAHQIDHKGAVEKSFNSHKALA